ncbi:hypothetical protein P171DRAFT_174559 [Karstenula rhodostoma CBS 690.94]|uniref:Uncharacterized protein n=1 Tax=Karstenula rhodostoma CBS 690.94 TaxID=1392251 RepID=A0A9P4P6Q4_9PLEO|nr:hypothetical protein P171DRAFT_174559 [Karstenula rhodostoma CBS 690.94]
MGILGGARSAARTCLPLSVSTQTSCENDVGGAGAVAFRVERCNSALRRQVHVSTPSFIDTSSVRDAPERNRVFLFHAHSLHQGRLSTLYADDSPEDHAPSATLFVGAIAQAL